MKISHYLLTILAAASAAYGLEDKETIRKSFPAVPHLEVDNVTGFIHVSAYNGSEIQVVAERRIEAEMQDQMDTAKRDVKLDIQQSGDTLTLFVDGPFRGDGNERTRFGIHDHGHHHYNVIYDFDIKVPAATFLRLGTVNGGDIRVENTTGDFDTGNVNGSIELHEVGGSGMAHTVNGKIAVLFARNPTKPCSFKTVNGSIETSFRPNLAADVKVKTFNGSAYTDFQTTVLPAENEVSERRNGKFVYRSNRSTGLRISNGGPEFKYETLNGSIRIINRGQ